MNTEPSRIPPVRKRGGVWVEICEDEYRIAPLGLLDLQELQPKIDLIQTIVGAPTAEQFSAMVDIVSTAMRRNYDIERDAVAAMFDLSNFQRILYATLNVAGLERRETPPEGETVASIGPASMPH